MINLGALIVGVGAEQLTQESLLLAIELGAGHREFRIAGLTFPERQVGIRDHESLAPGGELLANQGSKDRPDETRRKT